MKAKISKKDIKNRYRNILNVDADLIPNLLFFNPAFGYSTRVEGWACDYFEINNNTCFCSGYDPIGKSINRDLQKQFEVKAKKVIQSNFFKRETKAKKISALLSEFLTLSINH